MGYFPFFVELSDKEGLIAGGGAVALRKVEKLLPYRPRLTVAAPEILPEIRTIPGMALLCQAFEPAMLDGKYFVIAATDDRALNREIAGLCRERGILVNVADDPAACTFLFPALVQRGELAVGISTGGSSPSAAVWVKERIERLLPEDFEGILEYLGKVRPRVKAAVPEERRAGVFARLFQSCMEQGRPLEDAELLEILEETP